MRLLLISDLHLTSNPRDEYRWWLFQWLQKQCKDVDQLCILGDLTDAKDFHSAKLVNRIVDSLLSLDVDVSILRGNHDGTDPECPYFKFLSEIHQFNFIKEPWIDEHKILWLPHTRTPEIDWPELKIEAFEARIIFAHATFRGAVAENGMELDGPTIHMLPKDLRNLSIFAGDVHVPQDDLIGNVTYVGSPYHVHFGDKFKPRALLLTIRGNRGEVYESIPIPHIRRGSATIKSVMDLHESDLIEGDQLKIKLSLSPAEYVDWHARKKEVLAWCAKYGVELCGITLEKEAEPTRIKSRKEAKGAQPVGPITTFERFCAGKNLGHVLTNTGKDLLKAVSG